MRIWVSNKIGEEVKNLSWRSDVVLTVGIDEFHRSSVASFLLEKENKVALCCGGNNYTSDGYMTSIYAVGEDMCEKAYEDTTEASHLCSPVVLTYLPSLVLIQPKRRHKRRRLSHTWLCFFVYWIRCSNTLFSACKPLSFKCLFFETLSSSR